jgi:hypothetical protein
VEQARRNAELRVAILDEFGLLTADQVAELAGSRARNRRATASRWRASERIFSVEHQGQTMYPGFQFDSSTGAPKALVGEVLERLPAGLQFGGWQLAAWWVTPLDLLGWRRPVDLVEGDDGGELLVAATAEARDWASAAPH